MALSKWYADVLLPGSNAATVTPVGDFSEEFPLLGGDDISRLSFYSTCDSQDAFANPKVGLTKNVIFGGAVVLNNSSRRYMDLFGAVPGLQLSSSSSSSSCSCSSSSCSSQLGDGYYCVQVDVYLGSLVCNSYTYDYTYYIDIYLTSATYYLYNNYCFGIVEDNNSEYRTILSGPYADTDFSCPP